MKPAPFAYVRAASLDQVFDLLARHGDEARLLAGGQSLIPTLNLRLSAPALLIDINGLDELAGIAVENGGLRIGALTRQRMIEESDEVARHGPLLKMAMPYIAHPAIRNRGTIGGSIAFADPAAELPACAVALGAQIELQGAGRAARGRGGAVLPRSLRDRSSSGRGGHGRDDPDGRGLSQRDRRVGPPPRRLRHDRPRGACPPGRQDACRCAPGVLRRRREAGASARRRRGHRGERGRRRDGRRPRRKHSPGDLDPIGDLHASAATKLHLAGVLAARVLRQLAAEAP